MNDFGQLYVCATPIGNLGDITLRVLDILKSVDIVAAEDTRHTGKLLKKYDIESKLLSYHEHNKNEMGPKLLSQLMQGKSIALVSDAGMPGISDPGEDIIKLCVKNNIEITVCPGASAFITALVLSGLPTRPFVFEGFLPSKNKDRTSALKMLALEKRTVILYEAPHRIRKLLEEILEFFGDRNISIARELTKLHEEVLRCNVKATIEHFSVKEPKGEFVLVIEGAKDSDSDEFINSLTVKEHVEMYINRGYSDMDAIKNTAKDRGVPKREIYKEIKGE